MNILISGMNGTVAPVLAGHLRQKGHTITAWNRSVTPIDQFDSVRRYILETKPACFFHLATGSPDWAEMIARVCGEEQIGFLFTSTISVFANSQGGPFTVDAVPQPDDDYGRYKLECEQRIRNANPDAKIARIGWQIGTAPGSNNMVNYLENTQKADGVIKASRHWYPGCSFLQDTAASLDRLMQDCPAGLYHVDGNPGLSMYEIATSLNRIHGSRWNVVPVDEPAWNTRMIDERIPTASITQRLASV